MNPKKYFVAGESFSFSRTKVELFIDCARCFYVDRVKGISHPPGLPFSLNNAVDTLMKKEFDSYRAKQLPHSLVESNGLDLVPWQDERMTDWRNNFKGVQAKYKGYEFFGAVDDIWVDKEGGLYVVDYKATAKEFPVTVLSTANYHDTYRRQMEFYQWLLNQNGYKVSNTGYFVYTTGDNTQPDFRDTLKFRTHLIPYLGNTDWVETTLDKLIECASSETLPHKNPTCVYCKFVEERKSI